LNFLKHKLNSFGENFGKFYIKKFEKKTLPTFHFITFYNLKKKTLTNKLRPLNSGTWRWVMIQRWISFIAFEWYKELFNPMVFDPYNHSLKIQKSIGTPILKVGAHFGVWRFIPSHSLILLGAWNVTPELPSWPTPSQALTLVVSPRLKLQQLWFPFLLIYVGFNKWML